jgi:hypothetical protein
MVSDYGGPIVTTLPDKQTAFVNKYQTISPFLSQVPTPIRRSLIREDLERINRGQNPLSKRESALGILAAMQGRPVTEERDTSWTDYFMPNLDNPILRDIATIGASVPRLPQAFADEIRALPSVPQYISQATQNADNPLEAIGNVATAPGVRFLPGAFLAENLLGGTARDPETNRIISEGSPGLLLEHPLMAALDVAPVASAGLGAVPAVRAARAAAEPGARVPALRTALTRRVGPEDADTGLPTLVPNRPAEILAPAAQALARTNIGRGIAMTFGDIARDVSAFKNSRQRQAGERMTPGGRDFDDEFTGLARETTQFNHPTVAFRGAENPFARFSDPKYEYQSPHRNLLTRIMERAPEEIPKLDALDQDWIRTYRELDDRMGQYNVSQKELVEVDINGTPELYPREQANRILAAQQAVERAVDLNRSHNLAQGTIVPTPEVIQGVFDSLTSSVRDRRLGTEATIRKVEADIYGLRTAGYDVEEALSTVRKARRREASMEDVTTAVERLVSERTIRPPVDVGALAHRLGDPTLRDPALRELHRSIARGEWARVRKAVRTLRRRPAVSTSDSLSDALTQIYDVAVRNGETLRWVHNNKKRYGDKSLASKQKHMGRIESKAVPGRFTPLVQEKIREAVHAKVDEALGGASTIDRIDDTGEIIERGVTAEEIHRLIDEGSYELVPKSVLEPGDVRAIQSEVARTWQAMRDEGFDPVFVHHVRPDAANLNSPLVLEQITNPTQIRRRTFDFSPYVEDAAVGLNHAAMEWLGRQGSERFYDDIVGAVGKTEEVLRQEYLPIARRNVGGDPRLVRAELKRLMDDDWIPYDPRTYMPWRKTFDQFPTGYRVPRAAHDTISRMHVPPSGRLTQALDPGMRLFRTSVLPLSPRWHVYNIIGGGIMVMARTSPVALMKYARKAWEMTADPNTLPPEISRGFGSMPREVIEWNRKQPNGYHWLGGQKMRQLWDQIQQGKGKFDTLVEKSYDLNGRFDDMYRTIAYLEGTDKALVKGMTKEQAQQAGVNLSRKIMQDWDRLTPVERQIMRYVFPFYGWMQHVMRYAFTYPVDHPYRAMITAKFARNELEDMEGGLPERFMNMFFIGQPDENGRVRGLNLNGLNPFADVANYFTLAGFAGNAGPYVGSLLQMFGVDPISGGPMLYPDLRYDAQTGRLVADTGSPLSIVAGNFMPQSRLLLNYTIDSGEFKDQLRRNPDAAARSLANALGLPSLPRDINVYQELIDSELARQDAQTEARREALRTGEYGEAYRYPGLRAFLDQIRALEGRGALDAYKPESGPEQDFSVLGAVESTNPFRDITRGPYDEQVRALSGG